MYKNRSPQISLNALFFGSEQSKYAGIALFGTIFVLCLAILFSSSKIPIDQRLAFVIFIMIISIPSILMSLFELTCIVTGGNMNTRWWCWLLAWVISVVIILYCLMIILSLLMSMSSFEIANQRADNNIENNKIDSKTADEYAKNVIKQYEDDIAKTKGNNNTVNDDFNHESHEEPAHMQHQEPAHMQHQEPAHMQHQEPVHMQHQEPVHMQHQEPVIKNTISGFDSYDTESSYSPV